MMLCSNHKANLLLIGGVAVFAAVLLAIWTVRHIALLSSNKGNNKHILGNILLSFTGIGADVSRTHFLLPVDNKDRSMFASERRKFYIRLPILLVSIWLCMMAYDAACSVK
jgi:hypothetical protein